MNTLEITDLVKRYGDFTAVDHLNLNIKEGEVLGLLGPNGSGKSTTINCLLSLLKYEHGTIEIFGKKMSPNALEIKRNIGIVPQDVAVFDELNVYENIDYFCGLYVNDKHERKALVEEAIQFVGLQDFTKHLPKELSGGLLRRLNIACGVAHKPKLIILDEPTVAVDPQSRNKILEGIVELNKQGSTILYTSHYMEEIEQICTRVVIMDKGKEIATGTKEELKAMSQFGETVSFTSFDLSAAFIESVKSLDFVFEVSQDVNDLVIRCHRGDHNLVNLINHFTQANVDYLSVRNEMPTLNDVFLEITGKDLRD
ncbi:ABC transporter ATP-binding protein [Erysipelothrix sp. HDW6C]|uniref:ABC transporter ATP-binding protein n=1 Tax=Erysipelothrix sp. HDW6C TaxID=2714930 RepID=UPI0014090061|nr:ABC transporter ATP-binding protein [Erysipelothrix sp. HDW6C]QIK69621.1 ABC transporter ATP-binding protein [Erysipelothrix sp. HDW6C]